VLKINAKYASQFKNIEPLNFGLSSIDGSLPFIINYSNMGGSSIHTNVDLVTNAIEVNVIKLDDLKIFNSDDIALIKIDAEGHELEVLKGAKNTLSKSFPAILFEQQFSEISSGSSELVRFLEEMGYTFYMIKKNFYFGEGVLSKIAGLVMRTFFGERLDFAEVVESEQVFCDMILAVPKTT
jgi:FkbM family methyltransferase